MGQSEGPAGGTVNVLRVPDIWPAELRLQEYEHAAEALTETRLLHDETYARFIPNFESHRRSRCELPHRQEVIHIPRLPFLDLMLTIVLARKRRHREGRCSLPTSSSLEMTLMVSASAGFSHWPYLGPVC